MNIILFILLIYSITNIIVNEKIISKPINYLKKKNNFLNNLLSCPTCSSFWISIITQILLYIIKYPIILSGIAIIDIIIISLIASGAINLIENIKIRIGY